MAANDDLSWNTTRCNRLLRPLSTKLAKLRKELEQPRSSGGERRNSAHAFTLKASPRKVARFSQPTRKPRGFEKRKDPDWMPDAAGGTSRKTYGGRGMKKTSATQRIGQEFGSSARPGEIAFTPLIARTGSHFQESPQIQGSPLKRYTKNRGPLIAKVEQIQQLKQQMPSEIGNLVKGLSEAYANLLQATATGEEKRWKGTRSLLGACLRKMPEYIELEEHFAELDKEEDDDDDARDISQEIYTHLEAQFEMIPGQGWRSFRQIVRAHGTSQICDAFADQILGLETLHLLLSHCLNASAWDEAEKLLWSFLLNLKLLPIPNNLLANLFDEQRSLYMSMVQDFVIRTGRHRFLYEQLEYMTSQELLPLEWLATECMRPVWDRLVRSLSDGDRRTSEQAFRFLETAICTGIGLPDESWLEVDEADAVGRQFKPSARQEFREALDATFSSLLTVFCSIALVNRSRDETTGGNTVQRVTWVLDSTTVSILKRKDIRNALELLSPSTENMQTFAQRAVWVVFASFLVRQDACHMDAAMLSLDTPALARGIGWIASKYSSKDIDLSAVLATLSSFISSVARGTGRIWKDDGFDQMQRLAHSMLSLSGLRLPHKLWTMKRLALESAMEFAHSTGDPQHIAYARDIEKTMRSKGHVIIAPTPRKNDSPSASGGGFRWEEGIGEWVACTPLAKEDVKRVPKKPVRPLELLPTPEASQDEKFEGASDEGLPPRGRAHIATWETLEVDEDDYAPLQSSPVKKIPRTSTSSSFGKCTRASSPMVVIPVKRSLPTPPDTPIIFYPSLPSKPLAESPRRSRRPRKHLNTLSSNLRSQRSRSSLNRGLRNLERKTYDDTLDLDADLTAEDSEGENSDASSPNTSFSSSSSVGEQPLPTRASHSTYSLRKGVKRRAEPDAVDDRDELSKTPGLKRRRSGKKKVSGMREWWKVGGGVGAGEESEDELSFQ